MQKNNYFRSSTSITLSPQHHPRLLRGPTVEKVIFTKKIFQPKKLEKKNVYLCIYMGMEEKHIEYY